MTDLFDIDDGVLGIDAIWTWNGTFLLNDQAARPEWIKLSKVTGLFDGPDIDVPEAKRPGRIGTKQRRSSAGGKTVVLQAEIRSQSQKGLRGRGRAMRAAFAPAPLRTMSIAPHADLGGPIGSFNANVTGLTMDDEQLSQRWRRTLMLTLRLDDPRIYFLELGVDQSDTTSVTVTNDGSAPAEPIITVTDAGSDVTLTDGTSLLTFANVPTGDLVVDFGARTAKVGSDHAQLVVPSSSWWNPFAEGIAAGATVTIEQTGGAGIQVQFIPAVW